eukprot:CAMPEP_0174879016 /NCGR_PEP_ID=MMETSP1114-20130205/83047_1 /TAXON_ID=312471 /ORGANISM="Neobodo designis, Strain CCAP 1951/1" /LENGTH=1046 /DNA_ID=CAMNT_0016114405 /DNA_START=51 /DNA_END=3189 /DNA_ORIENTATION=+
MKVVAVALALLAAAVSASIADAAMTRPLPHTPGSYHGQQHDGRRLRVHELEEARHTRDAKMPRRSASRRAPRDQLREHPTAPHGLAPPEVTVPMPLRYAHVTRNASFTFFASCPLGGGAHLVAQWRFNNGNFRGTTCVVVSKIDAAGNMTDVATRVIEVRTWNDDGRRGMCAAGVLVVWADKTLFAVDSTGTTLFMVSKPNTIAVEGAAVYVTTVQKSTGAGQLLGYHAPSGTQLFNQSVPCTYAVVPQPTANATAVPDALWLGCISDSGAMRDGSTGALVVNTTGPLSQSPATAAATSALVGVAVGGNGGDVSGFGVSWTTGQVMWTSDAMATQNGNLFAMRSDLIVSLTQNQAPTPCDLVIVNARTGATQATLNYTCGGDYGVDFGLVPGSADLISVFMKNARSNTIDVVNTTAGARVLHVTMPAASCPATGCPRHLVSVCAGGQIVIAQQFPSAEGLMLPTRITTYSSATGKPIATSAHVIANLPLELTCGGDASSQYAAVLAPEAFLSVDVTAFVPPTATPSVPEVSSAAPLAPKTAVTIRKLWSVSWVNESDWPVLSAVLSPSGIAVVVIETYIAPPVLNILGLHGTNGSTIWTANSCTSNYPDGLPQVTVDDINGVAFVMCTAGSIGLNLTTGEVLFTSGAGETNVAVPAFAPGLLAYTNSTDGGVSAITYRTRGADGSWPVVASVPVSGGLRPSSVRIFPDAGVIVAFNANENFAPWLDGSLLAAVNITAGQLAWAHELPIASMPCSGNTTHVAGEKVIILGTVNTEPSIIGLDPATGAIAWTTSLAHYVDDTDRLLSQRLFATSCGSLDAGFMNLAVPAMVLNFSTVDGTVAWQRFDDRYYAPKTGTTFNGGGNSVMLWGLSGSVATVVTHGAWLLDPATGATLGRVSAAVARPRSQYDAFFPAGVPGYALGIAPISNTGFNIPRNLTAFHSSGADAGTAVSALQLHHDDDVQFTFAGVAPGLGSTALVGVCGGIILAFTRCRREAEQPHCLQPQRMDPADARVTPLNLTDTTAARVTESNYDRHRIVCNHRPRRSPI